MSCVRFAKHFVARQAWVLLWLHFGRNPTCCPPALILVSAATCKNKEHTRTLPVLTGTNPAIPQGWPDSESEFSSLELHLGDAEIFRVRGSHDEQLVVLVDGNRVTKGVLSVCVRSKKFLLGSGWNAVSSVVTIVCVFEYLFFIRIAEQRDVESIDQLEPISRPSRRTRDDARESRHEQEDDELYSHQLQRRWTIRG